MTFVCVGVCVRVTKLKLIPENHVLVVICFLLEMMNIYVKYLLYDHQSRMLIAWWRQGWCFTQSMWDYKSIYMYGWTAPNPYIP